MHLPSSRQGVLQEDAQATTLDAAKVYCSSDISDIAAGKLRVGSIRLRFPSVAGRSLCHPPSPLRSRYDGRSTDIGWTDARGLHVSHDLIVASSSRRLPRKAVLLTAFAPPYRRMVAFVYRTCIKVRLSLDHAPALLESYLRAQLALVLSSSFVQGCVSRQSRRAIRSRRRLRPPRSRAGQPPKAGGAEVLCTERMACECSRDATYSHRMGPWKRVDALMSALAGVEDVGLLWPRRICIRACEAATTWPDPASPRSAQLQGGEGRIGGWSQMAVHTSVRGLLI